MKRFLSACLISLPLLSLASCREQPGSLINTTARETTAEPAPGTTGTALETDYSSDALEAAGELARHLNDNSDFDFPLLTPWNSVSDYMGFANTGGFGCNLLRSADESTTYTFSGYPDALDKWVMTGFVTADSRYDIIGISCGMPAGDAESILTDAGFAKTSEEGVGIRYERDGWYFTLIISGGSVYEISVRFYSTNVEGVIF